MNISSKIVKKNLSWSVVLIIFSFIVVSAPVAFATTIGTNITTNNVTIAGVLQLITGAASNFILGSDASGNASWKSPATIRTDLGLSSTDTPTFAGLLLTTPLSIAQGGTGQTTANAALNALLPSQATFGGRFLQTDGTNTSWVAGNAGTVTSVDGSGGTTGLTLTGGPITTSGTLTLGGTLSVANGGTGQTTGASGTFFARQTLTSGTTYTPTAGTKSILVRLVGGGGGGGGATGTAVLCQAGAGGGSGSYAEKYFSGISDASTYTIAIGAGGTAGAAAGGTGGSGGNTTFACDGSCTGGAVTVTAFGGGGGVSTTAATLASSVGGAGGAVTTNGDLNTVGQPGNPGLCLSGVVGSSGAGARSIFGGGGNSLSAQAVGNAAGDFGSGGGGALSLSTAANAGGVGTAGVIVIWEFR